MPFPSGALLLLSVFAMMQGLASGAGAAPDGGTVYNIVLQTDSVPDLTDVDRYLRSITSQYATPQEKAISIWRWSQRLRKQKTNPREEGHEVLDPIRLFNDYGHCNCGIISGVNNALWLRMGWQAHYVQLGDHTVSECSWDGGRTWHMFDASTSFYCFNDRGEVASVREIEENPRFYLENFAPECGTNPVSSPEDHGGWRCASDYPVHHGRTLANGWDSFKAPNDINHRSLYAQNGRRFVLNLRPSEQYTRYFRPLKTEGFRTFRPVREKEDVDSDHTLRANGVWHYAPDLRHPAARDFVYDHAGVKWSEAGVSGAGQVTFKVAAANVVTSAEVSLGGQGLSVEISRDTGNHWIRVPLDGSGKAALLEEVAGLNEYLVRVSLEGKEARLSEVAINTITQINRSSLPRLVRGSNRVQLRLGPQVETIQFQPSLVGGNHRATAYSERGVDVNGKPNYYSATLRPAEKNLPGHATWKVAVPTPITSLVYGGNVCVKGKGNRVSLLHSWDGRQYVSDFEKTADTDQFDLMVEAPVSMIPAGSRTAFLRYEFETQDAPAHYTGPGIQMALMTVQHEPRNPNPAPVVVTYCWSEYRGTDQVERQHTEVVRSTAHEYTINVGGFRDPEMKWVRLQLLDATAPAPGYSDGVNPGPGINLPPAKYRWGHNLALGRSYLLEGRQSERNPDAGGDLTDGLVAPPDPYVSVKYMPTGVIFDPEVSPVITLDLAQPQDVAAVRLPANQEGGFRLTYPDTIFVETSPDGRTFTPAGSAEFSQVFDPPADFVPWELEDSADFADLPAGGRLAHAYRILLKEPVKARYVRVKATPRSGWGLMFSEVQVFDSVTVDSKVPPPVVLPVLKP